MPPLPRDNLNTTNVNLTVADDRSNILDLLSPLNARLRHQDIRGRRVENVGEWLLQTDEFRSWYPGSGDDSGNAVLFCYGDPGVGKTFISSLVIDTLGDRAGGQNSTVACFYFDFAAQKEQTLASVLGALVKQLVCGLEGIPEEISRAHQDQKDSIDGEGPQVFDIVKMMQTTSSRKPTFICIDGLDECAAGHRVKLLDSLNKVLEKSPGSRIFATGRPHILPEIGRCLSGRVTSVRISPKRGDIIRYTHVRFGADTTPDAMDSILKADILEKIPDVSDIFLLVSLNIDAILQETTICRRRQKLRAMTDGLGLRDAYGATLSRIKEQGGERARLGMDALMWISHSERPLKADELCHALVVEIGSENLNTDNVPSIGTLLTYCQGLVTVEKETSKVRLIHFTLQEYLRARTELFATAHSTIAETCLSYLNSQQVEALSPSFPADLRGTPFLEYSSLYWGIHGKREFSDCAKFLALKLFGNYNNHISTKILLKAQEEYSHFLKFEESSLFTGLHCASLFGIVDLVAGLIETESCDINQRDCVGNTSLTWAALNGHDRVVKILLERDDVHPGERDEYGQTPLCCAAYGGQEGALRILLGRDGTSPDKADYVGRTPLWWASRKGYEGAVKILLGRGDVSPNKRDSRGRIPLCRAAKYGHEGVVKILLERNDVNPNTPDYDGQTPLCNAAGNGHNAVVETLLVLGDISPNKPDRDGRTPLCLAAMNGHEGAVKILLGRDDVNPDKPDNHCQTPLWWAAQNRHEAIVKMLLEQEDVNPDKPDVFGRTPLYCAAECGHEGVVKLLLEHDEINPDKPNNSGQTPLYCASLSGYEAVVEILLSRDDVNPEKQDNVGQTPLHCGARYSHEEVVKVLLARDDVNPDEADMLGRTPLYCAAEYGHEGVVGILLEREDVNPEKQDNSGQTPLYGAAEYGHEGVVELLLKRDDVNPEKPDNYGRTPLCCAARYGRHGVVKILLERDDVSPNIPDNDGRTPLHSAIEYGDEGVVKTLLAQDDISPEKPDNYGRTPLWWAAEKGHQGVVKILLERDDVNPSQPDNNGRTPLWSASQCPHANVVSLLEPRAPPV